jgi:hypothetical protein
MPNITTCTVCGQCYEENSDEAANAPDRECPACWRRRNPPPVKSRAYITGIGWCWMADGEILEIIDDND